MKARTYSEVDRVEVDGVTFLVGWIPRDKFAAIQLTSAKAYRDATRRALAALKARGELPDDEKERKAAIAAELRFDIEWTEALEAHMRMVVAWGVVGHEALVDGAGAAVPFAGVDREFLGRKYRGAGDETVAVYGDVPGLIAELYLEVSRKNALSDDQKKVSSPPPSPAGGSTATSA
jgi:hypothetical protein